MSLVEWRNDFSTGNASVDHEHRQLIALINTLHEALGADADDDDIAGFLGEIHARIAAHFALEERMMRDAGYPDYEPHKADHERLLDDIREIMDNHEDGRYRDFDDVLSDHLVGWFSHHFRILDRKLHGRIG